MLAGLYCSTFTQRKFHFKPRLPTSSEGDRLSSVLFRYSSNYYGYLFPVLCEPLTLLLVHYRLATIPIKGINALKMIRMDNYILEFSNAVGNRARD